MPASLKNQSYTIDQFAGCIIGGAIGDAYGVQYENQEIQKPAENLFLWGEIKEKRNYFITDDTQLTLATCECILEEGKVDPASMAQKFASWYKQGKLRGLGSATLQAIQGIRNGGHWYLVGKKGEQAAGNGSAMRIAPLAFVQKELDRSMIQSISRITHHNDEAYAGSLAVVFAIQDVLKHGQQSPESWLKKIVGELPDTLVRDRVKAFSKLTKGESLTSIGEKFGKGGYVVESVPLALFGVAKSWEIGFEVAIEEMIKLGGDADTNAALMGQVAGAARGLHKLPLSMRSKIESLDEYPEIKKIISDWGKYMLANP
ncbi:MAG: ADP-ribosylglycohydrolase family protein [Bacteroidota bacterium]